MRIERKWAMPNKWTFKVKPIKMLLDDEIIGYEWADHFAGFNSPAKYTNDIEETDPEVEKAIKLLEDKGIIKEGKIIS